MKLSKGGKKKKRKGKIHPYGVLCMLSLLLLLIFKCLIWIFLGAYLICCLSLSLSLLLQINSGMIHVEGLLEPLLDLCSLESVSWGIHVSQFSL